MTNIKQFIRINIQGVPRIETLIGGRIWPSHSHSEHSGLDADDHLHYMLCAAGIDRPFTGDVYFQGDLRGTAGLRLDDVFRAGQTTWTQDGIDVSASAAEWAALYTAFGGHVSIIGALTTLRNDIPAGVESLNGLEGDLEISEGVGIGITTSGTDEIVVRNTGVVTIAAQGETGLTGDPRLLAGSNITITHQPGNLIEIAASGVVTSVEGLVGDVDLNAGSGITITNDGVDDITITNSGVRSIAANGGTARTGAINMDPGSGISITSPTTGVIQVASTGVLSVEGLAGDVELNAGSGITITDDGTDDITITNSGVLSVAANGGTARTGAINMDPGSGISITSPTTGVIQVASTGVLSVEGLVGDVDLNAGSGITITDDGTDDITITNSGVLSVSINAGTNDTGNIDISQGYGITLGRPSAGSIVVANSGVLSLEGLTGALNLVAGSGITITDDGTDDITITATAGGVSGLSENQILFGSDVGLIEQNAALTYDDETFRVLDPTLTAGHIMGIKWNQIYGGNTISIGSSVEAVIALGDYLTLNGDMNNSVAVGSQCTVDSNLSILVGSSLTVGQGTGHTSAVGTYLFCLGATQVVDCIYASVIGSTIDINDAAYVSAFGGDMTLTHDYIQAHGRYTRSLMHGARYTGMTRHNSLSGNSMGIDGVVYVATTTGDQTVTLYATYPGLGYAGGYPILVPDGMMIYFDVEVLSAIYSADSANSGFQLNTRKVFLVNNGGYEPVRYYPTSSTTKITGFSDAGAVAITATSNGSGYFSIQVTTSGTSGEVYTHVATIRGVTSQSSWVTG